MNLLTIETKTKSDEINSLLKPAYAKDSILWIGGILTHYPDNRNYIWIENGQPFTYTNWKLNNPDFSLNNEYCIQIVVDENIVWNDNVCENKYGLICEKRLQNIENEKHLQEYQKMLQEQQKLNSNFSLNLLQQQEDLKQQLQKQINLVHNLNKELQQFKENQENVNKINNNLQVKIIEKLQNDTENVMQILQKQQEWQQRIENKLQSNNLEEKQNFEDQTKKYRDLIFQANQNTYFLPNALVTFNGIQQNKTLP